jgi:hypothetical protein
MRISHLTARLGASAVATAVLLATAVVPAAQAADGTTVVHGLDQLPSDLGFGLRYASCTTPGQRFAHSAGGVVIEQGPSPVPAGERTWGFAPPQAGGAIGPFRRVPAIGNLAEAQVQVYADGAGADGVGYAEVLADDTGTTSWWGVSAPFHVAGGSWQTASALGRTYSWVQVGPTGPTGATYSGTLAAMVGQVGSDHGGFVGLGLGCGAGDSFHLDGAAFGAAGDVLTLDLEGPLTVSTIDGSAPTLVAGAGVRLRGVTTESGGTPLVSAALVLQAKAYGDAAWHDLGTAGETYDTDQHPAVLTARPLVATAYRWAFPGTSVYAASASPAYVVGVHAAVTAHPRDDTVRRGGTITVTGRVTPAKPGATVRLFRGDTVVARGTVRDTGRYAISVDATTRGTWHLHTVLRPTPGNLRGESPLVTVHVDRRPPVDKSGTAG